MLLPLPPLLRKLGRSLRHVVSELLPKLTGYAALLPPGAVPSLDAAGLMAGSPSWGILSVATQGLKAVSLLDELGRASHKLTGLTSLAAVAAQQAQEGAANGREASGSPAAKRRQQATPPATSAPASPSKTAPGNVALDKGAASCSREGGDQGGQEAQEVEEEEQQQASSSMVSSSRSSSSNSAQEVSSCTGDEQQGPEVVGGSQAAGTEPMPPPPPPASVPFQPQPLGKTNAPRDTLQRWVLRRSSSAPLLVRPSYCGTLNSAWATRARPQVC